MPFVAVHGIDTVGKHVLQQVHADVGQGQDLRVRSAKASGGDEHIVAWTTRFRDVQT